MNNLSKSAIITLFSFFILLVSNYSTFAQYSYKRAELVRNDLDINDYKIVIGIENKDGSFRPSQTVLNVIEAYTYDSKYYIIVSNFDQLLAKYGASLEKQTLYMTHLSETNPNSKHFFSHIIKVKKDPSENGQGKIVSSTIWVNLKMLDYMNDN